MDLNRSAVRHVAAYSLALTAGKLASVVLLPVYTRYLSPADYGLLEIWEIAAAVLNIAALSYIAESFFFFFAKAESDNARRAMVSASFASGLAAGGLVCGVGFWFSAEISALVFGSAQYRSLVSILGLSVALNLLVDLGFARLRAENRSAEFVTLSLLRLLVQMGVTLVLLTVYRLGYMAMVWGTVSTFGAFALYFTGLQLRRGGIRFDPHSYAAMLRFGLPIAVASLALLFVQSGDRFFLQRTTNLAVVGVYGLAYRASTLVSFAQFGFMSYWQAQLYRTLGDEDGEERYVRIASLYLLIMSGIAVGVACAGSVAIRVLLPPAYHSAIALIPVLVGAHVARAMADLFKSALLAEDRTKAYSKATLASAGACALFYAVLIPPFGGWGAAAATLLAFGFMAAATYRYAQKARRYRFDLREMGKICGAGAVASALLVVTTPNTVAAACLTSAVAFTAFAALLAVSRVPAVYELCGFAAPAAKALVVRALRTAQP